MSDWVEVKKDWVAWHDANKGKPCNRCSEPIPSCKDLDLCWCCGKGTDSLLAEYRRVYGYCSYYCYNRTKAESQELARLQKQTREERRKKTRGKE